MRRPSRSRGARTAAMLFALVLAPAGCAKREAPSGGPPDIEPPRIVSTVPDSGASGVPLGGPYTLTFSESMEPRSTGAAVSIAPYIEVRRLGWSKRTLTVVFAESLRADRTYTMFVGGTARDRHNNPMGTGATIVFSTADSFPAGRIEGRIEARGFSGPGTHLWCYRADRGGPDSTARDYDAIGFAGTGGSFRIDGLEVPGTYRLWGFADLNRNRSFEPETDVLAASDTVLSLTPERPIASGFQITMVNPRAPGRVKGSVSDSLADTSAVYRLVARSAADTTLYTVTGLEEGKTFDLQLAPGVWVLRAFVDLDRSRSWQPDTEPASDAFEVTVLAAGEMQDIELFIRRAARD